MRDAIAGGRDRQAALRPGLPCRLPAAASAGLAHQGRRRPAPASSWTSPCMMPTRCASCSATEPVAVSAMTQEGGMGASGIEDGVMGVVRFRLRRDRPVPRCVHHADTPRPASRCTASEGSLIATDVMTQRPIGEVTAAHRRRARRCCRLDHENLYVAQRREPSRPPSPARARPSATGEDGVCSHGDWRSRRSRRRGPAARPRSSRVSDDGSFPQSPRLPTRPRP